MTLAPNDENKYTLRKYDEIRNQIKYLIKSKNNNSDDCDEKSMQIKFNSDDDLPLRKALQMHDLMIASRSAFNDGTKYYPQVSLDECLYR